MPFPPVAEAAGAWAGDVADPTATLAAAGPETFRGGAMVSCNLGRDEKTCGFTPKAWPRIPLEMAAEKDTSQVCFMDLGPGHQVPACTGYETNQWYGITVWDRGQT